MENSNTMILFFTNVCNAHCRHCFVSPLNKHGTQVMDFNVFEKAIGLAERRHLDRVVVSGGESFLYWGKITEYLHKISINNRIRFSLCTNGYWACNNDLRKRYLHELGAHNFDTLEISTDSFHQEYIDLEQCIVPLIKDAISLGFHLDVTVCYERLMNEVHTINTIKQILTDKGSLHVRPISGFGSAKDNKITAKYSFVSEKKCTAAGELCVRYDGQCFICCGPPLVYDICEFMVGNIKTDNPESIWQSYSEKRIIDIMQNGSLPDIKQKCIEYNEDSEGTSLCHECICYNTGDTFGSMMRKERVL